LLLYFIIKQKVISFWYIGENNRSIDLGYIKRPKVLSRIAGNILEDIDSFSNSINIQENILYNWFDNN
jgi:hypothetical protein